MTGNTAVPVGKRPYGPKELRFVQPFVERLEADLTFQMWVLSKTKFVAHAEDSRLLSDEMLAKRSRSTTTWWRSHYTHACGCDGCSGQETDLLAMFETKAGVRFALHFEVKHEGDRFKPGQATSYPKRALCWVSRPPSHVLAHQDATTILLCSVDRINSYGDNLDAFEAVLTVEEVRDWIAKAGAPPSAN